VFAACIGTMEVLTEREREWVAGFVVNRFRGQESLLQDALDYTLRYTVKPVLGVIPYLSSLNLPEEDSVSFKDSAACGGALPAGRILAVYDIEPALDRLAAVVREHLRIETIYQLMGLK